MLIRHSSIVRQINASQKFYGVIMKVLPNDNRVKWDID